MARPTKYQSAKKERKIRVTDAGWEGAKSIALSLGREGVADLLEDLARGSLVTGEAKSVDSVAVINKNAHQWQALS